MSGDHDGVDPEKRSEDYRRFRRMMEGMSREDIRRMVERLTERVEANPRDAEALSVRGLAYSELGEHRLAAEDYGGVIALEPDNADAHLDRARAHAKLEEHRPAVADYDAAIRLAPGDAVAHYSRGGVQRRAGQPCGGDERLRRGRHPGPRRRRRSLQQGMCAKKRTVERSRCGTRPGVGRWLGKQA